MNNVFKMIETESQKTWQMLQSPITALSSNIPNCLIRLEKQELDTVCSLQYEKTSPTCLERLMETPKCENNTLNKFSEILRNNRINIFKIQKYERNNILSRLGS